MPDPLILDLKGVELEIRLWRGTDNDLLITCLKADQSALNLANYDLTFTMVDKPGGTVKFSQTKGPGEHTDNAAGQTIITVPASCTAGLSAQREYTWKYQIITHEQTTGSRHIHFFGDARIGAPPTPVVVEVLTLVLVESVTVTGAVTPATV